MHGRTYISILLGMAIPMLVCTLVVPGAFARPLESHFHNPELLADERLRQDMVFISRSPASPNSELKAQRVKTGELVRRITRSTHVTIALQATLQEEQLEIAAERVNTSNLMDAIGVAIGATWKRGRIAWILTDVPEAAHLVTQNPLSLVLETPSAVALNAFTPEQIQILKSGGKLNPGSMTPLQRKAFAARALETYMAYPDGRQKIAVEAFRTEGVFYGRSNNEEGVPPEVGIYFPRTDGLDPEPQGRIPFENVRLADPKRLANVTLPISIPQPLPEATWKPAARTAAEEQSFVTDTRLDVPYKAFSADKKPVVWQALGPISQSCGVDLIAATALDERKITVDLSHASVRDALKAVEDRTGGRWRPVREIYVLQQDPRVERAAHTWKDLRALRLRLALEAFQTRLSLTSRKALEEEGTLSPTKLTQTERAALIDAMVVAFGTRDNVAARAMELKDVTLQLLPSDKAKELPQRIRLGFPSVNGPAEDVDISWR